MQTLKKISLKSQSPPIKSSGCR